MIIRQPAPTLTLTEEDLQAAVHHYLQAKGHTGYMAGTVKQVDMHQGRLIGGEVFYSGTITFELVKKD